jgi:hypothetical protein
VNARVPVGPLAVLVGLLVGIATGEAAGPGSARAVLGLGIAGVVAAAFLRARPVRLAVAVLAFALVGTAVMQRALHGITASPLRAAIEQRADARLVGTLVDDPESSRFDARALVRVDDVSGRSAGGRRVLVNASGDIAGHLRLLSAGEGVVLRAGGSRRSRASTPGGAGNTRSAASTPPTSSGYSGRTRHWRGPPTTPGRWCSPAPNTWRPSTGPCSPGSSSATRVACPTPSPSSSGPPGSLT